MIAIKKTNDEELLKKIKHRIQWDKRVSLSDLSISVRNGIVILTGFVDTSYKKNAALETVSSIEGVWSVEDHVVVPADYFRTDEELKKIINGQLNEIVRLGGEHIEVDVVDGVVKLEGEVFRTRLKALAASIAWELSGVRDCLNFIDIINPPHRAPITVYEEDDLAPEHILSAVNN